MNLLFIIMGVFCIIIGASVWRLAQETPEDELVPWGCGAWRSHDLAYIHAFLAGLIGGGLILLGVIW